MLADYLWQKSSNIYMVHNPWGEFLKFYVDEVAKISIFEHIQTLILILQVGDNWLYQIHPMLDYDFLIWNPILSTD